MLTKLRQSQHAGATTYPCTIFQHELRIITESQCANGKLRAVRHGNMCGQGVHKWSSMRAGIFSSVLSTCSQSRTTVIFGCVRLHNNSFQVEHHTKLSGCLK